VAEHYTDADRARTRPIRERLLEKLVPKDGQDAGPWVDMDEAAKAIGARVGTCLSKMRELNDYHHAHLWLEFESRPIGGGRWEYRIARRRPGQLPLFESSHAQQS
jgi:hypothetical protein